MKSEIPGYYLFTTFTVQFGIWVGIFGSRVAQLHSTLRCADLSRVEVAPVAQMGGVTVWSIISRRLHQKITSVKLIRLGLFPLCVFAWSPLSTRRTRLVETLCLCSNYPMS